jgi:hypothetical protein
MEPERRRLVALFVGAGAVHLRVALVAGLLLLVTVPAVRVVVLHKLLALEPAAAPTLATEKEYINIYPRGSFVVINSVSWIRIRIKLAFLDPDTYWDTRIRIQELGS